MIRPIRELPDAVGRAPRVFRGFNQQSERTLLLGAVLLVSALSVLTGFILTQYYVKDVMSSLLFIPQDCWPELHWGVEVGRHCFGDYSWVVTYTMQPNPWAHLGPPNWPDFNYPAAGMLPQLVFDALGRWVGSPQLGLVGYLFALTIAVLSPALWAARGSRGLDRVVVFVACGAAAIPAWTAIDRGNSTGFVVPIALVYLVALCRRRWGLVTIMVILAALVKPQFVLLGVILFAARRWRLGAIAGIGVITTNLAAYLLWPRYFPGTIAQSIHQMLGYGFLRTGATAWTPANRYNVSFAKGLLLIPDAIKANHARGILPEDFLAGTRSLIEYAIPAVFVVAILVLGRRIPPSLAGIVLLATASLFPVLSGRYYLVFVLPIAALVVRNPAGPQETGIFDRLPDRRRAVAVWVSVAAALSIAQFPLPFPPAVKAVAGGYEVTELPGASGEFVETTAVLTPLLWLIASVSIIVSYARRPATRTSGVTVPTPVSSDHESTGSQRDGVSREAAPS